MLRLKCVVFWLLLFSTGITFGAEKHPMTLTDLSHLKNVSNPQLSPDGNWVAYVRTITNYEEDRNTSEIILKSTSNEQSRSLVTGTTPRWSPDSKLLAYRARRQSQRGIWLYDLTSDSTWFLVTIHSTNHFLGHRAMKNFEWSPLNYIKNVTTPTLFIHRENDHDVPITQAEEMFIGLKKRGVESVFVRYPGEGHGIRKPKHRLDYYQRVDEWFDYYLKQIETTTSK